MDNAARKCDAKRGRDRTSLDSSPLIKDGRLGANERLGIAIAR